MTEEAKLIVETLHYCEESGARCGGCPSGVLIYLSPSKIADLIESLSAQLEQVTRERDAAVEDLREADRIDCEHCIAHMQYASECDEADYICADCDKMCRCRTCRNNSNWQWRGVKVEG